MKNASLHIACLALAVVFGGCLGRTPPPKLYLLTALDSESSPAAGDRELAVGVGPVTLPEYLRRSEIVTRSGCAAGGDFCAELQLSQVVRWAEPLEDAVVRVLAEDLSVLLGTESVVRYPWRPSASLDFQVTVDLARFDADTTGRAVLTARWTVVEPDGDEVLHLARSSYEERAMGGIGAEVSALSRALAQLAQEIAGTLESLKALP